MNIYSKIVIFSACTLLEHEDMFEWFSPVSTRKKNEQWEIGKFIFRKIM